MVKYLIVLIMWVGTFCQAQAEVTNKDLFNGKNIVGIEKIVAELKAPQAHWRLAANKRIDKYRKADLAITVIDKITRQPVKNIAVELKMVQHQFRFGGIIKAVDYRKNVNAYQNAYVNFGFNAAGFCNGLKYKLRRGAARTRPEEIIDWLRSRNIYLRGHCLIWPGLKHLPVELAKLVKNYNGSVQQQQQIRQLCNQVIAAWAKKWDVDEWDVINEPRANKSVQQILGKKIEAEWFSTAQKNLKIQGGLLYLNENRVISDPGSGFYRKRRPKRVEPWQIKTAKVMTYYNNVKLLLKAKAPLSGLGFQSRFINKVPPEIIYGRLQLFNEFNLPIAATEFEMKPKIGSEFDKAMMTERVMTIYFSHPLVNGIYAWSLLSGADKQNRGLLDDDYCPNLRGKIWLYLTKQLWNSDTVLKTDINGSSRQRLFKGQYLVTVDVGGKSKQITLSLLKNKKITIEI